MNPDASQARYHQGLFSRLYDWSQTSRQILDLSGDRSIRGVLGVDQLGHFGPNGCDLVIGKAVTKYRGQELDVLELGSGLGGTLRYVVDGLERSGLNIRKAVGIDLVHRHCLVSKTISRWVDSSNLSLFINGDVESLPLRSAAFNLIFATGSVPHFNNIERVLSEVSRVLPRDGWFIFTEEVSLLADGYAVSDRFRASHPEGVFFVETVSERQRQLGAAGFVSTEIAHIGEWAADLIRQRLKAINLFRGVAASLFGEEELARIVETLSSSLQEIERGAIVPVLIAASR